MSFNAIQVRLDDEHYAAIRASVKQDEVRTIAPALLAEVHEWLTAHRIPTTGPALIRYLSIDSKSGTMDIHVGYPIAQYTAMHERVEFSVKPAGTYAIAVHKGPYESLQKTIDMLLDWAKEHSVKWLANSDGRQEQWGGRFEHYLIGSTAASDARHWLTEIAILRTF